MRIFLGSVENALTDQHESDYFVGYLCITFLSIIL